MASEINKIPPAIAKTLQASLFRIRRIVLFRGTCQTLAVLIASVLAIMAIDAMVTIYSNWVRWLLWCGAMAGTGAVAWTSLIKPLRRKISLADVALLIERNHPELDERLSTVVELAQEGRDGEVWSKELVNEITKCAIADIGKVTPKKEFTSRTIKPKLIAASAAVFVLAALFAAFPTATARLVARALVPSAEVDNIYASSLKVAPGDTNVVLRVGDSFKVSLAVDGGFPARAFIRTSVNGGSEAVERMVRITEEEAKGPVFYEFNYPSVSESFTYRVNCGSALTKAYSVKVVPTPTFLNRKIRIEHPAYTGREPTEYTNSAQIVGVNGSKVVISVDKPREDITGYITLNGGKVVEATDDGFDDKLEFSFDLTPELDGMWTSMAQDSNGFSNQVDNAAVTVAKDTPPTVELTVPTESEVKLPRSGMLPLEFRAKDDFKVSKAVIEIAVGAADYQDLRPIDYSKSPDGWEMGTENILIQSLKSKLGDAAAVQFRVRVEDNLPSELGGPGVAYSPSVLVEIVTQGAGGDKSLGKQSLEEQIKETKEEAQDIRKVLVSAQNSMNTARDLYKQTKNAWAASEAKNRHNRAKAEITNAEGLFAAFIQDLKDTRLSTGAAILQPVMDKHLIPVRQEIEDLYLVDPNDRYKPAVKVCDDFTALMKAYDEAVKKYEILTKKAEDMQKMEDMKEQQEALAEAAKEDSMSSQEMSEAEQKLMDEMNELMNQDMQRNLDKQIKQAEELAKKAEELANRQKDIKENKTGDDQKRAEDQLAKDIGKLAQETQKLSLEVAQQTGTSEMDEDKTTEPLENAQSNAESAQESAEDASDNLADQHPEDAKANMDSAEKSLNEMKSQLNDSIERMKKANERFAKEQQEMQEMMDKMNEAMQAAMDAAKAELGDMEQPQMSQEQMDQMQQMAQEQMEQMKMSEEQMKAMLDAMKEAMEQMKAMSAEMMKQMMEAMKDALASMDPEAMKQAMKDAMEQMKSQLGKQQKADMAQKMEDAAMEMGKMEMQQMDQMNMEPQAFKPQSPQMQMQQMQMQMQQMQMQMPQMPQQQQQQMQQQMQQMQQQMQQMQQQSQPDPSQPSQQESSGPRSNRREELGDDEGVDWFRMKSSSSSGAEADPMNDVPAEYRNLVKDYFKALNAGGKK